MICPNLSNTKLITEPFPHLSAPGILSDNVADQVLGWLREQAPWRLRIAEFYEQYEFSLLSDSVPEAFRPLTAPRFFKAVTESLQSVFGLAAKLGIVDVSAHRLVPGQTIRIHNDHTGGGAETHRLLIQLNRGWRPEDGGLLVLFGSHAPEDVRRVIVPKHGDGLAFEISSRSFHAVSQVKQGERYTLVYSFRVLT
jgi:Rps23 Pro-64 3,4-dihydroxylase Tpa1-like proline 4-hydroxylase